MNNRQKERIKKLVDRLLDFKVTEEHNFYMGVYIKHNEGTTCGTTGCALGYCPEFFPRSKWSWQTEKSDYSDYISMMLSYNFGRTDNHRGGGVSIGCREFFGIEYSESPFCEEYWRCHNNESFHEIDNVTPRDVAIELENLYLAL